MGVVLSVALAFAADLLLLGLQRLATPWAQGVGREGGGHVNGLLEGLQWLVDPANWSGVDGIPARVWEHVQLSVIALAIATLIAVPIGLWIGHTRRGQFWTVQFANVGRSIPSLAVLSIMFLIAVKEFPIARVRVPADDRGSDAAGDPGDPDQHVRGHPAGGPRHGGGGEGHGHERAAGALDARGADGDAADHDRPAARRRADRRDRRPRRPDRRREGSAATSSTGSRCGRTTGSWPERSSSRCSPCSRTLAFSLLARVTSPKLSSEPGKVPRVTFGSLP